MRKITSQNVAIDAISDFFLIVYVVFDFFLMNTSSVESLQK